MSSASPPRYGRIARLRSFLPLNAEVDSVMNTHGSGTLTKIISRGKSSTSLSGASRKPQSLYSDAPDDEEASSTLQRPEDSEADFAKRDERRLSALLVTPQMRSMRLIGNSNPRYKWEQYWKTEEELQQMKRPIREYYERNNYLIQQYIYIDRLLDSSLPHNLLNDYDNGPGSNSNLGHLSVPPTIREESDGDPRGRSATPKMKRTPRNLYRVPAEDTPLLVDEDDDQLDGPKPEIPGMEDESVESGDRIVVVAVYINLAANFTLLVGKIAVIVLSSSLSVLASLVDAALDFLSTAIVWTTTRMIARQDAYKYPVGRRRLEPIGVLVFSVVMVTSFFQVGLECFSRLTSNDHSIIQLGLSAILIMASTVLIKFACWLFCRFIKNSSVQALAQDAMTDVIFNIFSIIFPLVGYYAQLWWLDALGGLLLSIFVIVNWAGTSAGHIRNLTGAAATADERNVLLYLTMRFAHTIKGIQGLQAYHAGDKLNVEVDIVLDEHTSLRDSHDLGESLQYVLESVPTVDRAFVHLDYASWNLPTHLEQQQDD